MTYYSDERFKQVQKTIRRLRNKQFENDEVDFDKFHETLLKVRGNKKYQNTLYVNRTDNSLNYMM